MASHIVVGVDGSAPATAAVEWAAADAQRRGLDLRIVHVCEQRPHSDGIELHHVTCPVAVVRPYIRETS